MLLLLGVFSFDVTRHCWSEEKEIEMLEGKSRVDFRCWEEVCLHQHDLIKADKRLCGEKGLGFERMISVCGGVENTGQSL